MAISNANADLAADSTHSHPVQALSPDDANVTVLTASGTTSNAEISGLTSGRIHFVEVASISDIHMVFGSSGVTATSSKRFFPKGAAVYKLLPGQTHIAVIVASGSAGGVVTVTPLK